MAIDGAGGDGLLSWSDFLAAGSAVTDDRVTAAAEAVTPDDIMDVLFTSGTTGIPKGVLSAHRQTLSVARAWDSAHDSRPTTVMRWSTRSSTGSATKPG